MARFFVMLPAEIIKKSANVSESYSKKWHVFFETQCKFATTKLRIYMVKPANNL